MTGPRTLTVEQARELVSAADGLHAAISAADLASDLLDHHPGLRAAFNTYGEAAHRIRRANTPHRVLDVEPGRECREVFDRHGREWFVRYVWDDAAQAYRPVWTCLEAGLRFLPWAQVDAEHGPMTTTPGAGDGAG